MAEGYRYKVPEIAYQFPGPGRPGNAIRSWGRKGLIDGYQHAPNGAWHLSAQGVADAWHLWAKHRGLDPEADMPEGIRRIVETGATGPRKPVVITITIAVNADGVEVLQKSA